MPWYRYCAYNAQGKKYYSEIESPNLEEAQAQLFEMNIPLVRIQVSNKSFSKKKLQLSSKIQFVQQLSQLLKADIPLFESLTLLKKQFRKDALSPVIHQLTLSLSQGSSFSAALKNYPRYFDSLFCASVQMGEHSGQLEQALSDLGEKLQSSLKIKKKISSTLLYPLILACFSFLILALMVFYIVPSIETLFDPQNLGYFSRSVIGFCRHLKNSFWIYLLLPFTIPPILIHLFRVEVCRQKWDCFMLKIPWVKKIVIELNLRNWSGAVSLLLHADVALIEALKQAACIINNRAMQKTFFDINESIKEGRTLSEELKQTSFFSSIFLRLLAIGESTGEMPLAFERLHTHLNDTLEKKLHKILMLVSPLSLLFMAAIIALIMLAILIPLTDINALMT